MKCPSCGALLDDDSLFCAICGNRIQQVDASVKMEPTSSVITESAIQTISPEFIEAQSKTPDTTEITSSDSANTESRIGSQEQKKPELKKEVAATPPNEKVSKWTILRLTIGTLFIVLGLIRIASAGTSISSTSFGGDFYTYTYQGIVAVAEGLASIEVTLGMILTAIGAAINLQAIHSSAY